MRTAFLRGLLSSGAMLAALVAGSSEAAVVGRMSEIDFYGGSASFGYLGQSFTLSDNGSGFPSPVSASTSGTAMLATDFFGISVFFDPPRSTLVFDSGYQFASYPTPTALAYSATPSFIGLAVAAPDGVHYGYAEFAGTLLQSYAFETTPGVGIAAGAALVPEPETVALLGPGLAAFALVRRKSRV